MLLSIVYHEKASSLHFYKSIEVCWCKQGSAKRKLSCQCWYINKCNKKQCTIIFFLLQSVSIMGEVTNRLYFLKLLELHLLETYQVIFSICGKTLKISYSWHPDQHRWHRQAFGIYSWHTITIVINTDEKDCLTVHHFAALSRVSPQHMAGIQERTRRDWQVSMERTFRGANQFRSLRTGMTPPRMMACPQRARDSKFRGLMLFPHYRVMQKNWATEVFTLECLLHNASEELFRTSKCESGGCFQLLQPVWSKVCPWY